jgi:hypothetical protein
METSLIANSNHAGYQPQAPEMHPAIERIIKYVDMYAGRKISERRCHDLVISMIVRIESYNSNISRLNLDTFKQCQDIPSPIFHKINLDQKYENGKNLLDYVLPSPIITLLLIHKGLFSQDAIIYCIKNNYLTSLDLLLRRLTRYDPPSNGIEYNFYMLFLIKMIDTSIKDGSNASLNLICRNCKQYFPLIYNKPLVKTIMYDQYVKFDILIENGMNIQSEVRETDIAPQLSPLEAACVFKKYIFLKKLIDLGVEINIPYLDSPLVLIMDTPLFLKHNIFAERNLSQICLLLIKSGLSLSAMQNRHCNTYQEMSKLLKLEQLHAGNDYIQKTKLKNKIIQLMNDSLLLTISIKKANIPYDKIKIIRSLFFDFYWGQSQCDYITSKNFTIKNLKYFQSFINNITNLEETGKLLARVLSLNVYFTVPRTNLSYVNIKSFIQYTKNFNSIRKLTNKSLNNLNNLSHKILKKTDSNVFKHTCSFLDAPSLKTLSSINVRLQQ